MLKKRIKRALRSWGLVGPAKPTVHRLPAGEARAIVESLYRSMLKREASHGEREALISSLASGDLSIAGLVQQLATSDEFGVTFLLDRRAARQVAATVLSSLANVTSDAAIEAYATGLENGLPLSDFLKEICCSPEFKAKWADPQNDPASQGTHGDGSAVRARALRASSTVSGDLGQLVEDMILARLTDEGAPLALPPLGDQPRPPLSTRTFVGLLRTLDMMADRPEGGSPGITVQSRGARSRA